MARRRAGGGCRRSAPASAATARCWKCSDGNAGSCRVEASGASAGICIGEGRGAGIELPVDAGAGHGICIGICIGIGNGNGNCNEMSTARVVVPEALDQLSADDPAALRSRRDLARIHRAMRTRSILRRALRDIALPSADAAPLRVLELGAGDGSLLLGIAQAGLVARRAVELTLLDRQDLLSDATRQAYGQYGWATCTHIADVADWVRDPREADRRWDLIVANLFLHHFDAEPLADLLRAVAARTDRFFACEPRRHWLALAGSHLVGLLGANAVTRDDAVLSVHAGFADAELSEAWPQRRAEWSLSEYPAGLFSHCFNASRTALV